MSRSVSVLIRCFNEEAHIGRLLTGLAHQTRRPNEILLVDSGSTDATLAIASAFDVRILHITAEDFSFGRALNVGLAHASGDVVVLASAHVYPVYDSWIEHLLAPFDDDQVALSYGRQQTPPDGAYSEARLLDHWFPAQSTTVQRHPFCNNANAAIRRSIWERTPYDEDLTGLEDLDWARRVLAAGHVLSYVAEAPIVHVHDETFGQVVNRYRREAIAHKQIYAEQRMGSTTALRLAAANIGRDLVAARSDGVLAEHARDIIRFRLAQFYGTYRGFAQQGPVPDLLRRRFFYPAGPTPSSPGGSTGVGRPIDYDAPLEDHVEAH